MAAVPRLRVLSGGAGKAHDLHKGKNVIGRASDCHVTLDFSSLSQQHAAIRVNDDGTVTIEDLHSTNKTMLGSLDEPLELEPNETYPLNHGDSIVFGDVACVFLNANAAMLASRPPGGGGVTAPQTPGGAMQRTLMQTAPANSTLPHSPGGGMRPVTSALSQYSPDDQDAIRGQFDMLMSGMSQLYSAITGEPSLSNLSHDSSYSAGGAEARGMGHTLQTRPDLTQASLPQSVYVSPTSRSAANASTRRSEGAGTGSYMSSEYPHAETGRTHPGLLRHAQPLPEPASSMLGSALGTGIQSRSSRRRAGADSRLPTRGMSTSTVDLGTRELVRFGRFWLPEQCITRMLTFCPRVPNVLRVAGVNRQLRKLSMSDSVWETLDLSWDTHSPDPICHRMTDQILGLLLDRWYRLNIRHIDLSGCSFVTDWTLQMLSRFSFEATHLDLHCIADVGPRVTDAGVVELIRKSPRARSIDASWCARLGSLSLTTMAECCPDLTQLDLTGCAMINDVAVVSLASSYSGPRLTSLKLQSCELLTGDAVQAIAQRCTSLTVINLGACERVRGSAIADMVMSCSRLTSLDLTQCHQLTDTNLSRMAPHFTRIQRLRMGYCRNVSEDGFRDVARFCYSLHHCDVRGLRKLTDPSLIKLSEVARHLAHLDVRGCLGFSRTGIDAAARNLPLCNVLFSRVS